MTVSDVELDRVLNALTTTFNDQHPQSLEVSRVEEIATGSLGQERKIEARKTGEWSCALHKIDDNTKLATLERSPEGKWSAERERKAQGSHVAVPSQ
jgi:hypothetical protein